jgi:hypothetical protein
VAALDEPGDEPGADGAARAGDEDSHDGFSSRGLVSPLLTPRESNM